MAVEKDFELLDDYLSNRLRGQDKTAFEQKLKGDLDLKTEYQFQQKLVEGIRNARVSELKSMLNNTPVPTVGGETALFSKLAIGLVIIGLIGGGAYLYLNQNEANEPDKVEEGITPSVDTTKPQQQEVVAESTETRAEDSKSTTTETRRTKRARIKESRRVVTDAIASKEEEKVAEKRKLEVFDPTRENEASTAPNNTITSGAADNTSSITVETDNSNKKYTFHYQFKGDKLVLYGSFEKNLYEILEFFSDDKRTAFLYYKDNYYLLNDESEKVKPLDVVSDPVLIKKLKEYREN